MGKGANEKQETVEIRKVQPWVSRLLGKWDRETDVLIVGGGGAGLAAAIEAAKQGVKVLLLEKARHLGGETLVAAGIFVTAGTSLQRQAGINFPIERQWERVSKGLEIVPAKKLRSAYAFLSPPYGIMKRNPDVLKGAVLEGPRTIDWLLDLGVRFQPLRKESPTSHVVVGEHDLARMKKVIDLLHAEAKRLGVEILLETKGAGLYRNAEGRVVGATARTPEGKEINIKAKGAILATGGFVCNQQMVEEYSPFFARVTPHAIVPKDGSTGDGILMGRAIGAAFEDMDAGCTLCFEHPETKLVAAGALPPITIFVYNPVIIVNREGKRFFNEEYAYGAGGMEMVRLGYDVAYYVFDSKVTKGTARRVIEIYLERGMSVVSSNISELAKSAGISPEGLQDTVEKYNSYVDARLDPDFGRGKIRPDLFQKIDEPPYYCLPFTAVRYKTEGGLMANTKGQVLDRVNEEPIPGLYAAGATCGSVVPQLSEALSHGRIVGRNAAQEAR